MPTANVTASASRAAISITLGPEAATSTGTLGWPSRSQRSLLTVGSLSMCSVSDERSPLTASLARSNGTSSRRRYACSRCRWWANWAGGAGAMPM